MKNIMMTLCCAFALILCVSTYAQAESALLGDLKASGVTVQQLADADMAKERGTNWTILTNQVLPSQVAGYKEHQVIYRGWGSNMDTRSYIYHGSSFNPGQIIYIPNGSGVIPTVGDMWLADFSGNVNSWNRSGAVAMEAHLQVVVIDAKENIVQVSPYALHQSNGWNRQLHMFRW